MHRIGVHLNALRAFEAAGRHLSISRAAEELRVSHSTISHHVKGLEQALGVDLFERRDRSVVLTPTGARLLPVLSESFSAIATAVHDAKPSPRAHTLRVTVTPSFANRWLVPNLVRFHSDNSNIDVQLIPSLALADFRRDDVDVGIRAGTGDWPDVDSELLMPIHMTPMCSPALLAERGELSDPGALREFTLLHADVSEGTGIDSEWRAWLRSVDAENVDCSGSLSLHDPGLALQAATDGLGVAMGYIELAEPDLANGRLIAPFSKRIEHPWSYYVVTAKGKMDNRRVRLFRSWLREEVALRTSGERI